MDGGAGSTSQGVTCLDNWLRTQDQQVVKWDVIQFVRAPRRPPKPPPAFLKTFRSQNFGLHDMFPCDKPQWNHCLAVYQRQLLNITQRLVATGSKLQYALTTPVRPTGAPTGAPTGLTTPLRSSCRCAPATTPTSRT